MGTTRAGRAASVRGVRANARTQTTDPLQFEKEEAEATDRRTLDDPSVQKGDVVAISRGLVLFVGSGGEEHQPDDFLPDRRIRSDCAPVLDNLRLYSAAPKLQTPGQTVLMQKHPEIST